MIRCALAYFLPGRASGFVLSRSRIGNGFGVIAICLLVATGCVSTKPVVSSIKKDSTNTSSVNKDSAVSRETVEDKKFEQSNIDLLLWNMLNSQSEQNQLQVEQMKSGRIVKSTLDSIMEALSKLPKSSSRVITIPDTKGFAQLQFMMDSLGRMHLRCTALEKHYQERERNYERYISAINNRLIQKNDQEREQKIIDNRGFWEKIDLKTKLILWFIIFSIPLIIGMWLKGKLEKVGWVQSAMSVFKRKSG